MRSSTNNSLHLPTNNHSFELQINYKQLLPQRRIRETDRLCKRLSARHLLMDSPPRQARPKTF